MYAADLKEHFRYKVLDQLSTTVVSSYLQMAIAGQVGTRDNVGIFLFGR